MLCSAHLVCLLSTMEQSKSRSYTSLPFLFCHVFIVRRNFIIYHQLISLSTSLLTYCTNHWMRGIQVHVSQLLFNFDCIHPRIIFIFTTDLYDWNKLNRLFFYCLHFEEFIYILYCSLAFALQAQKYISRMKVYGAD